MPAHATNAPSCCRESRWRCINHTSFSRGRHSHQPIEFVEVMRLRGVFSGNPQPPQNRNIFIKYDVLHGHRHCRACRGSISWRARAEAPQRGQPTQGVLQAVLMGSSVLAHAAPTIQGGCRAVLFVELQIACTIYVVIFTRLHRVAINQFIKPIGIQLQCIRYRLLRSSAQIWFQRTAV
jgi:hypothetical protein